MSEVVQPQVEKQPKPLSPEQYLKNLERFHRQTKLECEVAEYQIRRVMAQNQMNQFRNELLKAQQEQAKEDVADSVEVSASQESDVDILNETTKTE